MDYLQAGSEAVLQLIAQSVLSVLGKFVQQFGLAESAVVVVVVAAEIAVPVAELIEDNTVSGLAIQRFSVHPVVRELR